VREDFFDVAYGVYRYPGSTDWGQHELLFDPSSDSIFVYGVNRSKPGLMEPFSYTFVRRPMHPTSPNIRCSEPGHHAVVAVHTSRGPGR
jgi:hypothetical protein